MITFHSILFSLFFSVGHTRQQLPEKEPRLFSTMPAQFQQSAVLRDTTNERTDRFGNFWGTRFKSTSDASFTPSRSPATRRVAGTPGSAARPSSAVLAETPSSGARDRQEFSVTKPKPTTGFKYQPSPQRSLFQRYLLKEIDHQSCAPTLTVVFDLDETLVSNRRADLPEALLRAFCIDALQAVRKFTGVEVVLWTASTEETGGPVVEQLERQGKIFDDVIFRNDLWFTEPMHTKDLRLLGRNMDRVVVFDNAPNCVKLNRFNAVLVDDYHGEDDSADQTLVNVCRIIQTLAQGIEAGSTVPEMLRRFGTENSNGCRTVYYALPDNWKNANLRDISPVMVPPQGKFFKITKQRLLSQ